MLVEFRVANFQCFRDEAVLSLVPAGQDRSLRGNIWAGKRHQALKSAAIFGPNASGKSSLLRALSVLQRFVTGSATKMTVGDPIPGIDPFRLAPETREQPSCFEVLVELDGAAFRYRVEATASRVIREKLEHQDAAEGSRWLTLIDRDETREHTRRAILHYRLGSEARRDQIIDDTRENALVLSRAAERSVDPVIPVFQWFKDRVSSSMGGPIGEYALGTVAELAAKNDEFATLLSELIRDADTGIAGLQTEGTAEIVRHLLSRGAEGKDREESESREQLLQEILGRFRFYTLHQGASEQLVRFELEQESEGTRQYLRLVGQMVEHLRDGFLMVVDELDASLHPQLARRVVELAHSPILGSAGAQFIFSTHDTTLMDPALMRRDQIFITQKNAQGASELYSLWDFERMPRKDAAWAKNYLAGRFGGVPAFGPALADIPQGDEPTKVEWTSPQAAEAE